MKNLLTILLLLFTASLSAQIDKIVNGTFNLTTTSTAGGTGDYVVQGTFTDLNGTYAATDVQVGDFYLDASGDLFEILVINTQIGSILNLDVQDVDNQGTLPSGNGAIFRMTRDGYVPIVNGVSATLQSKINNFAIYSIREEVDLAGCTDTITEVGHGLAISNPVSLAGASDYNAIADQTTVPVAFVLDVIDANTYVLQRCGLVRISDLPTATQTTWNGIADGLYYVDELGGITSTTPVTGLIRPTIYKGDGRIQVVQFYGFGQSSGGSGISDGTYNDVTVSGGGTVWTVVSATTTTAGKVQLVDEDNMVSDSDALVPTQQSVKAYVDNNSGSSPWDNIDGTEADNTSTNINHSAGQVGIGFEATETLPASQSLAVEGNMSIQREDGAGFTSITGYADDGSTVNWTINDKNLSMNLGVAAGGQNLVIDGSTGRVIANGTSPIGQISAQQGGTWQIAAMDDANQAFLIRRLDDESTQIAYTDDGGATTKDVAWYGNGTDIVVADDTDLGGAAAHTNNLIRLNDATVDAAGVTYTFNGAFQKKHGASVYVGCGATSQTGGGDGCFVTVSDGTLIQGVATFQLPTLGKFYEIRYSEDIDGGAYFIVNLD